MQRTKIHAYSITSPARASNQVGHLLPLIQTLFSEIEILKFEPFGKFTQ